MRFLGDRLGVRGEIDVARDTAICARFIRSKHCGIKGASFSLLTRPTTDMPFVPLFAAMRSFAMLSDGQ